MRLQSKSISKVNLTDILRRRKITLKQFLNELGIVSYNLLVSRCQSMGVAAPSQKLFLDARDNVITPEVSSPTEGVVVLTPPEIIVESTGKFEKIDSVEDAPVEFQPIYNPPQYPRRKKSLDKPSTSDIAKKLQKQQKQKSRMKKQQTLADKPEQKDTDT